MQCPRTSEGPAPPPFSITDVPYNPTSQAVEVTGSPTETGAASSPSKAANAQAADAFRVSVEMAGSSGPEGSEGPTGPAGLESEQEVVARRTDRAKVNGRIRMIPDLHVNETHSHLWTPQL